MNQPKKHTPVTKAASVWKFGTGQQVSELVTAACLVAKNASPEEIDKSLSIPWVREFAKTRLR